MSVHHLIIATALLTPISSALAGPPTPADQQIFYRAGARQSTEILVAAKDGSNISSLGKFSGSISFDVGSRDQGIIAVTSGAGLQLLRYAQGGAKLVPVGVETLVPGVRAAAALDLSPDGTRIAYRGGDGTKLMVYTIADKTNVEWDSGMYVWDVAWAKGGNSIVYLNHVPMGQPTRLYEITAPQQRNEVFAKLLMDRVEVSRTDGDILLLSYASDDGLTMIVGTWRMPSSSTPGTWVTPSLTSRDVANRGVFSCDDSYVIFGSSAKSGAQTWYTKVLPAGNDQLITKVGANAEPQSWSGCQADASDNNAFQFRVPPN